MHILQGDLILHKRTLEPIIWLYLVDAYWFIDVLVPDERSYETPHARDLFAIDSVHLILCRFATLANIRSSCPHVTLLPAHVVSAGQLGRTVSLHRV